MPAQEKCVTTTYAAAPAGNPVMLAFPDQVTTVSGPCGTAPSAGTLISDKKIYYDGDGSLTNLGTFGQLDQGSTPVAGWVSATRVATGYSGSTENWQTTAAMKYDGAGRVTDTLDATGQNTHTGFTPAWSSAGGNTNPTSSTSTNSQGWTVTSTLDALRGLPTENIDVNGRTTDITYDALGRRTAVWLPGRDKAAGKSADLTFTYSINPGAVPAPGGTITQPGAPSSVTTKTLREDETYGTSITIYDGLLQPRQTQATAMGDTAAGRVISDSFYDSHGWQTASYAPYSEPANTPSTTLFAANENQIPAETTTTYDGQGRPTASTLWHQAVQQWTSTTAYKGADETDSTAPAGGPSTATFTNALGQTTSTVLKNSSTTVKLTGGQIIPSGTSLTSSSVRLTMKADGNLVLTSLATGKSVWSTNTSGHPGAWATFQTDGNFVVYDVNRTALWASGTYQNGTAFQVQNDANLVIYNGSGSPTWSSNTWHTAGQADSTTEYTYTPAGQVATIQDTAGNTWSYTYNLLGRKASQTDPNTGTTTYDKYDTVGNLLQTTDPRGQVLSYAYDWDNRSTAEYSGAWSATPDPAKQLASWTYDTLAKGYPTSSTRYVGGTSGKAYTQAVSGYNTAYQPTGTTLTIPAADGFAAAGQNTAPTSGSVTYTTSAFYTPTVGLLSTLRYQADGNLPAEDVGYGYTQQGNLDGFGGFISAADTPDYLDTTVHDAFGRVLQTNYGPTGKELATFAQYDATTGRVTQTSSMLQTSTTALDVVNNRYNQAGEVTAIDDLRDNTTHDTQCFSYDSFQRLTAAWTDTAGITDPTSAKPGAVGGCTTGSVQTTSAIPVTTTTVGGPAPYWQTYTYDLLGDRTGMVGHDTTGNALNDTTQATAYAGSDGTVAAALPNQAGTLTTSNPALGTATQTTTYADPAYANKNAGDSIGRTATTSSALVSSLTNAGARICVDDASSSTTDGNKIQIWTCNGTGAQTWSIGTDGTVKVLGKCLDAVNSGLVNGTKIDLYTCNGSAAQQWKAATNGSLVNPQSGKCLDDPGSSTTSGTQLQLYTCNGTAAQHWTNADPAKPLAGTTQSFTYDAEGRTATVTTPSGGHTNTSSYLYGADGSLLEQTSTVDGADTTRILYLFGGTEQITQNVPAKTWTGLRYYHGPDGTTITRSSSGSVTYQVANAQGTATTAIDAGTMAVTRRSFDPWGNPRGTQPSTWVSADENHSFLGQPADSASGLNLLGARTYDPALGRFLTPDPIFEAGDPNQMGGYTYAGDNPATGSDRSGLMLAPVSTGGACADSRCLAETNHTNHCYDNPGTIGCGGDDILGQALAASSTPGYSLAPGHYTGGSKSPWKVSLLHVAEAAAESAAVAVVAVSVYAAASACAGVSDGADAGPCFEEAANAVVAACGYIAGDCGSGSSREPIAEEPHGTARALKGSATAKAEATAEAATINAARNAKNAAEDALRNPTAAETRPSAPATGTREPADSSGGKPGRASSDRCSFSPDTPVLLEQGKTKPIGKIKSGDKVEAADPKTGKHAGPRTVTATWINHDTDLLDVTIRGVDGKPATLHTTANHPFWDDTAHTWVPAGRLKPGHALNTNKNHHATVLSTRITPGPANRYNLTVTQFHTYYVVAGSTPVLVHNSNKCDIPGDYLYRGLPKGMGEEHPAYQDALQGRAVPKGGHSDPARHAGGDTDSEFTSWTHDYEGVALDAAEEFGVEHGLVLRIPRSSIPEGVDFQIHDTARETYEEMEHSLLGTIEGAEISVGRGPWTRPGG